MGLYSSYIFPRVLDWLGGTPYFDEQRKFALEPTRGSVLEIGFGTGLNLPHYPLQVTKLTVVEPGRMLPSRVARRIAKARMPVEQFQLDASRRLPFDDKSFDSVVTTLTLCSIGDVTSALAEIRRVLKRDGKYVFLEHGRSDDPRVAKRQDLFNPIQKIVGCGCNMNRPIDRLIKDAGFEIVTLERFLIPDTPRVLSEMYRGTAKSQA
ncbi:MAG TPA: class I SAM-dependent methyltransferase [Blastocatellia bacterium]|jgi:ubiquinone/menaquinone biosynthesis C-methylase UbiE|nr:class I SAM-dependent methyltransferase [Blastocatellia bacterium]